MALNKINNINNINNINVPIKFRRINVNGNEIYEYFERCTDDTHDYCKYIKNLINKHIENKDNLININLLRRYFLSLNNMLCFTIEYPDHLNICKYLLDNILNLNRFNYEDKLNIFQSIKNVEVAEIFMKYLIGKDNTKLDNIFKKNNNEILLFIFKINNNEILFIKLVESFIQENKNDMTDKNIFDILEYAIQYNYISAVNFLINMGIKIDNIIFNKILILLIKAYAIHLGLGFTSIDIIKKCILNGAIINKDTLNIFLLNIKINGNEINSYHTVSTTTTFTEIMCFLFDNGSTDINFNTLHYVQSKFYLCDFLNYIVDNGHNLTVLEFGLICDWNLMIKNISKIKHFFEITEIKNKIIKHKFKYPITITYDIENLKSACKDGLTKDVCIMLKTVKPTQECIELASINNHYEIIKILRETYHLKFNNVCLLNIAQYNYRFRHTHTQCLKYITELYLKKNNIQQQNNNLDIIVHNKPKILGLSDDSEEDSE